MKFKTELHCHSRTVSDCASITPAEIVEKYLESGYTTVVLADHLSPFTFSGKRYTGGEDWQSKIDYYMEHYNKNDGLSANDIAKWTKASKGLRKKADIVAAYESAGATHEEATTLYALMYGHDKAFNTYYKQNGG